MKNSQNYTYDDLKNDFERIPVGNRLGVYLHFCRECSDADIVNRVEGCAADKVGFIIPEFEGDFDLVHPMELLHKYSVLLECAERFEIKVALNLQREIEGAVVRYFDDLDESIRSKVLLRREYYCSSEESVSIPISDDLLSVVAVEERGEIIDLREQIDGDELIWQAPRGNWKVCRYFCSEDDERDRVNMLNYSDSRRYIDMVIELFRSVLDRYFKKTLAFIAFSDICFSSVNRRNWDEGYNNGFAEHFGYDPAPYYPCLYDCFEESQRRYKAMLMDYRARMLKDGIVQALYDAAGENGMMLFGSITEPKLSACSWVVGDAMLLQSLAPCAKLEKSYLYGINSVEIASGAAEINDRDIVACEAFGDYNRISEDIVYRETSTAFARGANMLAVHFPKIDEPLNDSAFSALNYGAKQYSEYVGRLQSILCGGETISDIAVLYPIHSLHSSVSLYEMPTHDGSFEYPETPDITDYMSVINSIGSYSGKDPTLLHPDILSNELKKGKYKVLVMPAMSVIGIDSIRAAAEFFDNGGKILATGVLPGRAAEVPKDGSDALDREVRELISHIFGSGSGDENITGDYIYNCGEGGGEAYFIYSTVTGVDRCNMVPSRSIYNALSSFDIPYDVYIEGMPRMECTGVLNAIYPEYCLLGLSNHIRGGGMMNYIHKKRGDTDIYFFANSTDAFGNGYIYLSGEKSLEIWDALSGSICPIDSETVDINGTAYTKVKMQIAAGESVLIVGK